MELDKLLQDYFNLKKDEVFIANFEDTEDIGIVTHYKGKPLTGIAFWQDSNSKILDVIEMKDGLKHGKRVDLRFGRTKIEFYKNDLQEGKHTYESISDLRFPSFESFEYNLYFEQGKCINYDENFIKNCVNKLFRAHCLNVLNATNEINDNSNNKIPYEQFVFELRGSNKKILDKAISELKVGFQLKIKNNSEEIDFCKTIDSILESRNLSISEENRGEFIRSIFTELVSKGHINNGKDFMIVIMNYLKGFKKDIINNTNDDPIGITNDELIHIEDEVRNEMNELEGKRKNSNDLKKHILSFFGTKIDSFYFYYDYILGEGIDFDNINFDYDDNWVPKNDDQIEQIWEKIYDLIYDYFDPSNYFDTDGYCTLYYENNKLLFEIEEEDPEDAVEFDFDKMQHVEKVFPEDYKPLLIKWEITDKGIIEIEE